MEAHKKTSTELRLKGIFTAIFAALIAIASLAGPGTAAAAEPGGARQPSGGADTTPSAWAIQKTPRVIGPEMAPDKEGLLLGPVRIHGGISVSETYTSNYFQEANNPHSNWITTFSPFLLATLGQHRNNIQFEYRGDYELNKDYSKGEGQRNFLAARFKVDLPSGLLVTGGHEYSERYNIATAVNDESKQYVDNVSSLNAVYTFADRYSVGATYQHTFRRFDKDIYNADDLNRDDVSLAFYYRILPKTRVFVEGGWNSTKYTERNNPSYDSNLYRLYLGVRTQTTDKLAAQIKGGWLGKDYTDNRVGDDISGWGLEGDVEYALTTRTMLNLNLYRKNDDTQFSTNQNPAFGASYDRTGLALRARHNFTERFHIRGNIGYELMAYHQPPGATGDAREDKKFFGGAGLEYKIWKAIYLGADYSYTDDDSNIEGQGYIENRVMFYVTLGY